MRAFLFVVALLGVPAQDADEQYTYVAALAEKGLHDRVVREAREFLRANPNHAKAELARYRLACALFGPLLVPGDPFVEVSTGGTQATNVPVNPGKQAQVPIPNLPAGTVVVISVGKGLKRRILVVEIVEED